ncbi:MULTISPECIES: branched-chain amino acid ABC transporter permease [Pandoraea]|uniref:Amino acid ABC transporter n=1 Tax=Pandoraea capi TaxID=2508286 RepID=A0ABY6W572_9BURK|nr:MULTISPECIES: branched-chain amino acid ABC transporter permease [Pandoraea]MCI3208681.1 branched-chain amino acid ABC transporter permease [Pandoraea sp. LA3]MDN4586710.1 branched-chain amino acid ABC transporter permease [Pandoraea capi]VVE26776.1 amino acid ABC transporter [Pandoraea capi]
MKNHLFARSVWLGIVVLAVLPWLLPNAFMLDVAIRILFAGMIAVGLNLLMGFAGQISIGHAAFVAMGGYASGILTTTYNLPPSAALVCGAVGTGIVAWIIARPMLRLRGHSLTMATLGLGIIVNLVLINEGALTGGPDGMAVGPFGIGSLTLETPMAWYVAAAVLLVIVVVLSLNLYISPAGRALRALHGTEVAARVMGVDATAFKARVFVLSAVIASLAGGLLAHYTGFITPQLASFMSSVQLATIVVVGGMASTFGVVLGAALIVLLPQLFGGLQEYELILFGLVLMVTMIFLPRGIVPTLANRFMRGRS